MYFMRPTDYPYHHPTTLARWRTFKSTGSLPPGETPYVDPLVLASWTRCVGHFERGIPALNRRPHLHRWYEQNTEADLITLAVPYLEDICQISPHSLIFLTDERGDVLAIEGDLAAFHELDLQIGERWAEPHAGTNAIGLALLSAMPVQVVGAEHYLTIFHAYGGAAAPIHNEQGDIVGCIGILTHTENTSPSQLATVMAAAKAITTQLQSILILEQANQRLMQMDNILESMNDGVIAWDMDGTVEHVNSMACQVLGTERTAILGHAVTAILDLSPDIQTAIVQGEPLSDVETRFNIEDRIVHCTMSVRPIADGAGEVVGGVAMLRPLSQLRSLVNQQVGARTSLTFDDFHYESVEMRRVLREAEKAARGALPVLLIGEGGVGKSALAQAIHNAGPRANKPFIGVNCRMIPGEMVVNELLGIARHDGAPGRPSKFELADGGTLLIDQIDQMSLQGQATVLQVINSRHVVRLHAERATPVNVRIIATSAVDLEELVASEGFLPQLYYLFNVFKLHVPSLRERPEDVHPLLRRFLLRHRVDGVPCDYEAEVVDVLRRYPFPGNVRELESVIERAVIHSEDGLIRVMDLPDVVRTRHSLQPQTPIPQPTLTLEEAEREAIIRAGWAHQGTATSMAQALGINRSTLWRKMKQFGLSIHDFK